MRATMRQAHELKRLTYLFSAVIALQAVLPGESSALIVKTYNGVGTPDVLNDTAPVDDPGWQNIDTNRAFIYLGNQWVITANHVAQEDVQLPSGTYSLIPGSAVTLTNPATFNGSPLSALSDIKMFRIDTHPTTGLTPEQQDPGIKTITIASQSPSANTEILMIGGGFHRRLHGSNPLGEWHFDNTYNLVPAPGANQGFLADTTRQKIWGTNEIISPSAVPGATDDGQNILVEASGLNDQIGQISRFDRGLTAMGTPLNDGSMFDEAQADGGDSGGPVFHKDGAGDWVLGGVMHAVYRFNGQTSGAIYGNFTAFSDLSVTHYRDQIESLRPSNLYSVLGDIDLDGSVTGEIINDVPTGDLAAFVQGWLYQQAQGDIISWKQGDLNQDGMTDLSDFVLLREALGGTISTVQFAALVAQGTVPEPSTWALAFCLASGLLTRRSRRAR